MFQPRSKDFPDPRIAAIVNHLRAIQDELGEIGKSAGRRGSVSAAAASHQIADALAPILNNIVERFWRGQRAAVDQAAGLGNQAVKASARAGNEALARIARQTGRHPLLTLAVAVGVGILIGAASRRT
jgi:ElaB/YqjD/DUF883 family membrane-anchored ribosome-binding protein